MAFLTLILCVVVIADLLGAQILYDPYSNTLMCSKTGGNYCSDESLSSAILISCVSPNVAKIYSCNIELSDVLPPGYENSAVCYQSSPEAGDAVCAFNGTGYTLSGNAFSLPETGLTGDNADNGSVLGTGMPIFLPGTGPSYPSSMSTSCTVNSGATSTDATCDATAATIQVPEIFTTDTTSRSETGTTHSTTKIVFLPEAVTTGARYNSSILFTSPISFFTPGRMPSDGSITVTTAATALETETAAIMTMFPSLSRPKSSTVLPSPTAVVSSGGRYWRTGTWNGGVTVNRLVLVGLLGLRVALIF